MKEYLVYTSTYFWRIVSPVTMVGCVVQGRWLGAAAACGSAVLAWIFDPSAWADAKRRSDSA
jgi:hypothetical protein